MKVYYAHCMAIYDSPQELRDVELLKSLGFKVVNPNSPAVTKALAKFQTGEDKMAYFERFADQCDMIVFRALPDGSIPGGVAKELDWFKQRGKPALELPHFALRRVLDKDTTRAYLAEVGSR